MITPPTIVPAVNIPARHAPATPHAPHAMLATIESPLAHTAAAI
jgi:hypothetical protein